MSQPSLDLGYDDLPDPTFTVTELADAIDQVLRRGFRDGAWVRGEIEGLQRRSSGHVYFSLAERNDGGASATVPVVLFGGTLARLEPMLARHRMRLTNGLAVRVHVRVEFYAPAGRVSLVMDGLDPKYTLGQLAAGRDELMRQLSAEGLLDANKRRPLRDAPLQVGVITSVGSAAWHDLLHELEGSGIGFRLFCANTQVQGDTAVDGIVAALAAMRRLPVDVVLVVRGGGSRTDLATFDHERIARAIAASEVPVWTGLGHEIDRAVADEVAHRAHKTPTACGAALVAQVADAHRRAESTWSAIAVTAAARLDTAMRQLERVEASVERRTTEAVIHASAQLDTFGQRITRACGRAVQTADREITAHHRRVQRAADGHLRDADRAIAVVEARTAALDPALALARGWSITRTADGALVRSVADVAAGSALRTTVLDGDVASIVTAP